MTRATTILGACLLLAAAVACGGGSSTGRSCPDPDTVTFVVKTNVFYSQGEEVAFDGTIQPSGGSTLCCHYFRPTPNDAWTGKPLAQCPNPFSEEAKPDVPGVEVPADRDNAVDEPKFPHRYEIIPLMNTDECLSLTNGTNLPFHAKVIDIEQGVAAVDTMVLYAITKVVDLADVEVTDADGALEKLSAYTGSNGVTDNTFFAGMVPDRRYEVTLSLDETGELAEPKTVCFLVSAVPCGCAEVQYSDETKEDMSGKGLTDLKVYVLPADWSCDDLDPANPVPQYIANRTMSDVASATQFDCLPSDNQYTLFSTARGPHSCVAAAGCTEGVYIKAGTTSCPVKKIKLYPTVMSPTGMFDCVDHFDFSNVIKQCSGGQTGLDCITSSGGSDIGKDICCVLQNLLDFFNNPAKEIVDIVIDALSFYFGQWIQLIGHNQIMDVVTGIISDWILNSSPDWLKNFFTVGQDMLGIITNLELKSDLQFSKLGNEYTVQGTQYWKGLVLYWKIGCNPQDPNYETCGAIPLTTDQIGDIMLKDALGHVVEGKFMAQIFDYDVLSISAHPVKLNYGKLVLYVLDELLIATLTKGKCTWTPDKACHSFQDVAKLWFDCHAISEGIVGDVLSLFGVASPDIEQACSTWISNIAGFMTDFLGALSFDSELSLQGTGTLVDKDCDLKVDEIINGKYVGYVQGSGVSQASITGDFHATKK